MNAKIVVRIGDKWILVGVFHLLLSAFRSCAGREFLAHAFLVWFFLCDGAFGLLRLGEINTGHQGV